MDRITLARFATFVLTATLVVTGARSASAGSGDCPAGGIRFGVEPYESAAIVQPLFAKIGDDLSRKMGCPVTVYVATSYNAEIEAMRAGKLDVGEFGALSYVLAHKIANAQAFASYDDGHGHPSTYFASIITWPGSGIRSLRDLVGRSFAFSDPVSASGHLLPAYAMRKANIDPDRDVRAEYAGSHVASFEAIRNRKVDAGELNSQEIAAATAAGIYDPANFVTLWTSQPVPTDPIAVRGDLPEAFRKRLEAAILALRFTGLTPDEHKHLMSKEAIGFTPVADARYDVIRDLVATLNIDLTKL